MPQSVIIGIHGLNNKPAKDVLRGFWEDSLAEGLLRNHSLDARSTIQLNYWADIQYQKPLSEEQDKEPYLKALGEGTLPLYDRDRSDTIRAFVENGVAVRLTRGRI
jgi:hypothetical protein